MSGKFIKLGESFWVAPQLNENDIADAAAAGFMLIINNRPDGEVLGQPNSAVLEEAAQRAGVAYACLPVDGSGMTAERLAAFDALMKRANGKTLAFCRSGARSTLLRAYAQALNGRPASEIINEARMAGYDIAGHAPALAELNNAKRA